jgi:protoporphyrinogen oxidase
MLRLDDRIVARNQVDMPYAYVVYDMERKKSVKTIREWLSTQDILLAGRYSEWEYYNSDHAFIAGRKVAARVIDMLQSDADQQAEAATTA